MWMHACDWQTDVQGWTAARTAYVVHLTKNNNISLTVNNGPGVFAQSQTHTNVFTHEQVFDTTIINHKNKELHSMLLSQNV